MTGIVRDLRHALRLLRKNAGFTLVASMTLALAIGVNTSIFSIVNAVLFKPLPVSEPAELVQIYSSVPDGFLSHEPMANPDFEDIRAEATSFRSVEAYAFTGFVLESETDNELIMGEVASGGYFETLGLRPALGRFFSVDDDRRGAARSVTVLSHATWQSRFGGDPSVLGSEIRLNGQRLTILGVAPEGFHGLTRGLASELWIPLQLSRRLVATTAVSDGEEQPELHRLDNRRRRWLWVVARREAGVTVGTATSELSVLGERLSIEYPDTNEKRSLKVVPLESVRLLPGVDAALYAASTIVMVLVGLVLLIASSNLANMLLSRAVSRRKEMATRLSLGASRAAVLRQLATESLLLALLGGTLGLGLAQLATSLFSLIQPRLPVPVPIVLDLSLDFRVLFFTFAASAATALIFGLTPALQAARTDLAATLNQSGRSGTASVSGRRMRQALVIAQVALSLVLLICAGLSLRSMVNAQRVDPGFDPDRILVATLSPQLQGYAPAEVRSFYRRAIEALATLPGVQSASAASHVPLSFEIRLETATAEGRDQRPPEEWEDIDAAVVSEGYFETMKIPLLQGRGFSEGDQETSRRVVVVNQRLADQFWPGEEALGKRIRFENGGDGYWQVIGVVANGKYRTLGEATRPYVYRPFAQAFEATRTLLVDFGDDTRARPEAVRRALKQLDDGIAIAGLESLTEAMSPTLLLPRMGAALFGLFGLLGLALASIGIYGVISYSVSRRTQEIGIRMALGAARLDVERLVVRDGVRLTAIGLLIGLATAVGTTRVLSAVLYGISATDLLTFVVVSLVLLSVAFGSSYLPARRASGLSPVAALHHE